MNPFDFFDMSNKKYDYLDSERKKLWVDVTKNKEQLAELLEKISKLNEFVEKKTSDYKKEARYDSGQVTKYKNRANSAAIEAQETSSSIKGVKENLENLESKFIQAYKESEQTILKLNKFSEVYQLLNSEQNSLETKVRGFEERIDTLEDVFTGLDKSAESVEASSVKADSTLSKVNVIHNQISKKHLELSGLHDEIFGYTSEDPETGEKIENVGLKDHLDGIYTELEGKVAGLDENVESLDERIDKKYEDFELKKSKEFEQIKLKVRKLLPDAMTAGLSSAYETKRKSEESEGEKASSTFKRSVIALTLFSIIPVAVSIYSMLYEGKSLYDVVLNTPQVVLAILPLYLPAFWFAISASKRIKLSKRLTEEYAHKESLSKTFEGLTTQIENLPEGEESDELKLKLLANIISVSAENPGKLISDYNNTDHPLLDSLKRGKNREMKREKEIEVKPDVEDEEL